MSWRRFSPQIERVASSAGNYSRLSYGVAHSHCTQIYSSQKITLDSITRSIIYFLKKK